MIVGSVSNTAMRTHKKRNPLRKKGIRSVVVNLEEKEGHRFKGDCSSSLAYGSGFDSLCQLIYRQVAE